MVDRVFLDRLNKDRKLPIHRGLLRHVGPEMAVFLSYLVDQYEAWDEQGLFAEDDSFVLTHMDLMYLTRMSGRIIRRCKKEARELGLLKTKMKDVPPKEYYYLDLEAIWLLSQGRGE